MSPADLLPSPSPGLLRGVITPFSPEHRDRGSRRPRPSSRRSPLGFSSKQQLKAPGHLLVEERAGAGEKGVASWIYNVFRKSYLFIWSEWGHTLEWGTEGYCPCHLGETPLPVPRSPVPRKCPLGEVEVLINSPRQTSGISFDLQALHL